MRLIDGGSLAQAIDRLVNDPPGDGPAVGDGGPSRALRPSARHHPPRPEASQHPARRRRPAARHRLRPGQASRSRQQPDAIRGHPGHAQLHGPGAGGWPDKDLTTAADVYALGAILYELLTGRPPFRGESVIETLQHVVEREPQRPRALDPGIDRDLETICLKCLEKDPRQRYSTAEALVEDLEAYMRGEPVLVEVGSEARLMRRLLRETRHTEVMALWGRVWMWHAVQVFLLFLISNALVWAGTAGRGPMSPSGSQECSAC